MHLFFKNVQWLHIVFVIIFKMNTLSFANDCIETRTFQPQNFPFFVCLVWIQILLVSICISPHPFILDECNSHLMIAHFVFYSFPTLHPISQISIWNAIIKLSLDTLKFSASPHNFQGIQEIFGATLCCVFCKPHLQTFLSFLLIYHTCQEY